MSFRARLINSFPVFSQWLGKSTPPIRKLVVSGGAAGEIAVTGIQAGDQLVSVIHFTPSSAMADLTSEFVANTADDQIITTDGVIDNTGGTATTGDQLIVTWIAFAE